MTPRLPQSPALERKLLSINDIRTTSLSVQVDEDERLALAAASADHPGDWTAKPDDNIHWIVSGDYEEVAQSLGRAVQAGPHIARHDPRRERAEVALKRLILEEHKPGEIVSEWVFSEKRSVETVPCLECSFLPSNFTDAEPQYVEWPCAYVRALEAIYTPEES